MAAEAPRSLRGSAETPAEAVAAVVDSANALVRAELRLAATEARAWLFRIAFGLGLLWLSLLLAQVFVLLLALSPALLKEQPWTNVALMLALSLAPLLGAALLALRELHRIKDVSHAFPPPNEQRS
jgi:CDP-diglyceride synthetase